MKAPKKDVFFFLCFLTYLSFGSVLYKGLYIYRQEMVWIQYKKSNKIQGRGSLVAHLVKHKRMV